MTILGMWQGKENGRKSSDGLALKALVGLITLLWGALLTFVVRLDDKADEISGKLATMESSVIQIQKDIRTITDARSAEATEARSHNTRRIEQLEAVERVDQAKQ